MLLPLQDIWQQLSSETGEEQEATSEEEKVTVETVTSPERKQLAQPKIESHHHE